MWPVVRKWAMEEEDSSLPLQVTTFMMIFMIQHKPCLQDFTDIAEKDHEEDVENGEHEHEHERGYHFTPSLIKKRGFSSIHQIARDGHHEVLSTYLESVIVERRPSKLKHIDAKTELEELDNKGNTPLHYAVRCSFLLVIASLLTSVLIGQVQSH